MSKKIVIIDGSSLIYRAFYALPQLTNSQKLNTGAVYGFLNMLLKIIEQQQPNYIVVAFDKSRKTFRTELYTEYKAQRKATPDELVEQFPLAMQLLAALGITSIELDGFEADDIIGTIAKKAQVKGLESIIVTGDKDALQLIDDKITVFLTKKGISELKVFDKNALKEEYGLLPEQIPDLKGLMGDSSDNIPGIAGVGGKTALKLLLEYHSVENLLDNSSSIKGKLGEKISNNKDIALLSKKLATIEQNIALPFEACDFTINPDIVQIEAMLKKLEFKNVMDKVQTLFSKNKDNVQTSALEKQVEQMSDSSQIQSFFKTDKPVFLLHSTIGDLPNIQLDSLEVCTDGTCYTITGQMLSDISLKAWLEDSSKAKVALDAKNLYQALKGKNIELSGLGDDVAVMAYLIDSTINNYSILSLCNHFFIKTKDKAPSQLLEDLYKHLFEKLEQMQLINLYKEIELPLVKVLSIVEMFGISVDKVKLDVMSQEIYEKIQKSQNKIYDLAGEEFNINSPKQLGSILFEKLAMPVQKKTKTGYSTDAQVLDNLSGMHPIVDEIIEYRILTKLYSTYLEGLKPLINSDTGKIYTHFQQLVTTTGRLSSTEPNLQNIPVRTPLGKKIRELFVPSEGFDYLVSFDYSQVELRILAHISQDPLFMKAFKLNEDIHSQTASEIFNVDPDKMTKELRSRAKAVNFGIVYGISDFGLARDIGISITQAKEYIDNYFKRYPKIHGYMQQSVENAKNTGYALTIFGRRRYLPDLNNKNFNLRSFAQRNAINMPIQGTAADIMKIAMLKAMQALKKNNLKSQLLLQVHDELVFQAPKEEIDVLKNVITDAMQEAASLEVPLIVDSSIGKNWAETKD